MYLSFFFFLLYFMYGKVPVWFCVTRDWNYSGEPIVFISLIIFTYLRCELMDEEWNDINFREITFIFNLTKDRTKTKIDLPPNLRLIDIKIIFLSNHASC